MLLGMLLGGVVAKFLFVGSYLNLLPWGLGALIVGWYGKSKKEALCNGAVYGFALSFVFMLVGYSRARSVITVMPFFALLGLFGALCGAILGLLGFFLRRHFNK